MIGNQNDSKMIGFQKDRKGPSTMINRVNTMTPRQNDLVVKNIQIYGKFAQHIMEQHTVEKLRNCSHQNCFPSNQLFNDLFSKCDAFTKFLRKNVRVSKYPQQFLHRCVEIAEILSH